MALLLTQPIVLLCLPLYISHNDFHPHQRYIRQNKRHFLPPPPLEKSNHRGWTLNSIHIKHCKLFLSLHVQTYIINPGHTLKFWKACWWNTNPSLNFKLLLMINFLSQVQNRIYMHLMLPQIKTLNAAPNLKKKNQKLFTHKDIKKVLVVVPGRFFHNRQFIRH